MLGIIGAMQEEVEQLISAMNVTKGEKGGNGFLFRPFTMVCLLQL